MIPLLAPLFQGELAPHGETLALASRWPEDSLPVVSLLNDHGSLEQAIRRYAAHLGVTSLDLRAVASSWSLDYLSALLPPVVAAASILQHRFPMRSDQVAVTLNGTGLPVRFHIVELGEPMSRAATAQRYADLLEHHLAPLFSTIHRQTRLPLKILWASVARHLDAIFERALALVPGAAQVAVDRDRLLREPVDANGKPNPRYARQRRATRIVDGRPFPITLYRQCCLLYRLPGSGYCGPCPLSPEYRRNPEADAPADALHTPMHDTRED